MKKRTIIIGLIILLAILIATGDTKAWFTHRNVYTGQFTLGTIDIEINEALTPLINLTSKKEIQRGVLKRGSDSEIYVRVALIPQWDDSSLPIDNVDLILADNEDWAYKDGWYYHKEILKDGRKLSSLLEEIQFKEQIGPDYQGKTLRLKIIAEAVQAAHDAYKDVWGIDSLPR